MRSDCKTNTFCEFLRRHQSGAEQNDQKFLASPADHIIGSANAAAQRLSHLLQDMIACLVTMLIVHLFEQIDITHDHGEWRAMLLCAGMTVVEFVSASAAIEQTGQVVIIGLLATQA